MKQSLLKQCVIFLITTILVSKVTFPVLATENYTETTGNFTITPYSLNHTIVPSNGSVEMPVFLNSYLGFTQSFIVNATSNSTSGMLIISLYDPNGNIVSHDWVMGVNEFVQWNVFLPTSGEWKVRISAQGTKANVEVFAGWKQ